MRLLFVLAVLAFTAAFSSSANANECWAKYEVDTAGHIQSGWVHVGNVSGTFWGLFNKRKQCRDLASSLANNYVPTLLATYAPPGSGNLDTICNRGYAYVRIISQLRNPFGRD